MENNDTPKKFKSAYIIYSIEERKKLKEMDPKLDNRMATKLIAEEWKKMSNAEKEKYKKLEEREREKFNLMKKDKKYVYRKTQNKEPIRHRTPYMFFISENKDCLRGSSKFRNIENIKILSEKWKNMKDEEKLPYIQKAILDKERFKKEWEDYIHFYMKNRNKTNNKQQKDKYKNFIKDLLSSSGEGFIDKNLLKIWKINDFEKPNKNDQTIKYSKKKADIEKMVFAIEKIKNGNRNAQHEKFTQKLKNYHIEKVERDIDEMIDEEDEEDEIEEESEELDLDDEPSEEMFEEESN